MKKLKFLKHIDKVLLGSITTFLFIVSGFIYYVIPSNTVVPIWSLVLCGWVSYIMTIVIYCLFKLKPAESSISLPKVLAARLVDDRPILLMDRSDLYNYDCYVSIYYWPNNEEIEILLGWGIVESIRESDKKIQVHFCEITKKHTELVQSIFEQKSSLKSIRIKPTVSKEFIEYTRKE